MRQISQIVCWASDRKGLKTEHGAPVSRCEQLMAAGGPQMLSTTSIRGRNLVTCLTILGVEMQAVEVDAQKHQHR